MTGSQNLNGTISGDKACEGKCVRKENIAYQGYILGIKMAYDDTDCKDKCANMEKCMYWTYSKGLKICNLFSNMTGSQNLNGTISGDKACEEETEEGAKNCKEETMMAYYGNNIDNGYKLRVDDKQSCIKKCIKRTGCHYWTYRLSDSRCFLKSSDGGRQSNGDYVSGKICGKAEETNVVKNCKEEAMTAYYYNNLPNGFARRVDGKQSCIKMCIKRAGCHYWSYSKRSCWLKSSDRGRSYARNFVSGKICGKEDSPK